MDVYQLVAALGGEIVRNKARARVNGEIVVIGELGDDGMQLNEAGRRLVNQATSEVVEPKKTRKSRPSAVESVSEAPPEVHVDAAEVGPSALETPAE